MQCCLGKVLSPARQWSSSRSAPCVTKADSWQSGERLDCSNGMYRAVQYHTNNAKANT